MQQTRGHLGRLVEHVSRLGVEAITGKPYKPTTQGKNERFHQTLFRYLDKQPLAPSLFELQGQVDAFDEIYNTQRPHQGLPGRVTPQTAWNATPKVEAPRPRPAPYVVRAPREPKPPTQRPANLPDGTTIRTLSSAGTLMVDRVTYKVDGRRAYEDVLVIADGQRITIVDLHGEVLIEHTRPAPGITYVGNGNPRGPRVKAPSPSPMS